MTTMTAVKERPILFSGPMVRAILEGRKTQTRRVMKPQLHIFVHGKPHVYGLPCQDSKEVQCPYGNPGDRLWVRETWASVPSLQTRVHNRGPGIWPGVVGRPSTPDIDSNLNSAIYRADGDFTSSSGDRYSWRPSIHMPRWASRILLEITDVRAERLNDISGDDLAAEGLPRDDSPPHDGTRLTEDGRRMWFADIWESINGPGSWDANPWVFAIGFRVLEGRS